jgi:serine/threonine protein kinase
MRKMKRSKSELILLSEEFRTHLMNEQKERDPLFYYKVVRTIGNGSMGSVALVKKRSQTVGGSARKNVREAVRTHKRKQRCFQLPFGIGGLFRLCIEDELRVEEEPRPSAMQGRARRGSKNALLSIETWLGSSEGSSGVSSSDSSKSIPPSPKAVRKSHHRRESSILLTSERSGIDRSEYSYDDDGSRSGRSTLDHEYAMKSIHLSRVTDDDFVQELKNEIAILKKLDHPHIVRPLETYYFKHQIFIVMEHCSGGDLYSRDPYTEEEAARIISSVLSAVSYLHANNVAHRDLKYENILFVNNSPKAEIKLIDFGLSKVYGMGGTGPGIEEPLTEGVGTIYTMAPEVLKGSYTKQADVWSVGVIAYMLLSSQMPFYGRKRQHIVEQILGGKYDFRGRRWRKIGTPAKDFVRDLLVVDPEERLDAERASSCVWLNKRFAATVRGPKDSEILQAKDSMYRYAGYTKLKKMALMVVAHRSTCEEIGILRKVFQKYASKDKSGCISYPEFKEAWKESGLPAEDTKVIFDAVVSVFFVLLVFLASVVALIRFCRIHFCGVLGTCVEASGITSDSLESLIFISTLFFISQDLDGSGRIRYTEFLAATIEAQGAISEERLAEAFDRFDTDDSGYISVDNLTDVLGKDFPRQEIIDILGDAVDPSHDGDGDGGTQISYSAFLRLWERNHEANRLRMLGSQANLAGEYFVDVDKDYDADDTLQTSFHSTDDAQEAARARATFLMDKHGTLGATASEQVGVGDTIFEDTVIAIPTNRPAARPPKIIKDYIGGEDDFSMGGGIQI